MHILKVTRYDCNVSGKQFPLQIHSYDNGESIGEVLFGFSGFNANEKPLSKGISVSNEFTGSSEDDVLSKVKIYLKELTNSEPIIIKQDKL